MLRLKNRMKIVGVGIFPTREMIGLTLMIGIGCGLVRKHGRNLIVFLDSRNSPIGIVESTVFLALDERYVYAWHKSEEIKLQ